MYQNQALQLSGNRYYQGRGALDALPGEVRALGSRTLIVADFAGYEKVRDRLEGGLKAADIASHIHWFKGHCSPGSFETAAALGRAFAAQSVIGVGGGRAIDTAKVVADLLEVSAVTVPTAASTCASTALLAVQYTDEGRFLGNYWPRRTPVAVIADLDVLVLHCPVRYHAAGIIDAMAKYPEIRYNALHADNWGTSAVSRLACAASAETFRFFLENGEAVLEKMRQGQADEQVENSICSALSLTGLISCLAADGKQAAISHGIYSFFCNEFPALTQRFLHGELVGASLAYQLLLCEGDREAALALARFLRALDAPDCLDALGFPATPENMGALYRDLRERVPLGGDAELERIKAYEAELIHGVY